MEQPPPSGGTDGPAEESPTGYAVERYGSAPFAAVLASLVQDADLGALSETIDEFGLETVTEQYLRALIDGGTLQVDEAAATAEADRILDEDPHASPAVHAITVAELADEFTRLGLTAPASSFR